jgi:hypothetical protein
VNSDEDRRQKTEDRRQKTDRIAEKADEEWKIG